MVVALTLGCEIDEIQIGRPPDVLTWNLSQTNMGDAEAICAAGYAREVEMGRREDKAWELAHNDRSLLAFLHAERTGMQLEAEAVGERFRAGAANCVPILSHPTARVAIEDLAAAIGDRYEEGAERMSAAAIQEAVQGKIWSS